MTSDRQPNPAAKGNAEIRLLSDKAQLRQALATFRNAMVGLPSFGIIDDAALDCLYEPGRTYGAFDGTSFVGTTDSYSGKIIVPGGRWISHAAVTHVGVLPTHTRRGIASALFRRQLQDLRMQGVAIATLRASDARIYGHFGYGIASTSASYEIDTERAILRSPNDARQVRLIDASDAWPTLKRIYAGQPAPRTGTITRSPYWWDLQAARLKRSDAPVYVAVSGEEGAETGYVRYHPIGLDTWFTSAQRTVIVNDFVAHDISAYRALVSHLLAVDLPHRLSLPIWPVDDPLPRLFTDFRAVSVTGTRDEIWLRILDVEAALSARAYHRDKDIVLEIRDPILPGNNGRWQISSAGVSRTDSPADTSVDISGLSAAYLGGTKWWQLEAAGQVVVRNEGVITQLDRLFATAQAPFSGTMF